MLRDAPRTKIPLRDRSRGPFFVVLASLIATLVSLGLLACEGNPLAPRAGLPEYRELATMTLPGPARLDVAGGNLLVSRTDLDLDTQLGPFSVGAVWNSAERRWIWSFDGISFSNGVFTDATGAKHSVGALAAGSAIPGTIWVKVSQAGQSGPNRLKTKGGLEYAFSNAGRLLSIRWTSSAHPRLQFTQSLQGDGVPHPVAIEQCIGVVVECHSVFTIGYDSSGRVTEISDRAGRRALFLYDASGRLVSARDGFDVASDLPGYRYEYSGGDLTAITNSEGERVEYAYDAFGRLLRATQIGEDGPTRSFSYRGRSGSTPYRTIATDPLGAVRIYRYDGNYQLLAVEDVQSAETTSFAWSQNRVTSRTTPDGATVHWVYSNDDVTLRIEPSGNITSYSYQPDGVDRVLPGRRPLLRIADSLGTLEERSYDAAGRLVSLANGAGEIVSLEYGADEMPSTFTNPAGIPTSLSGYGEHGHATTVSRAGIAQTFGFDAVGNLTDGADLLTASGPGLGGIVSRAFDEDRNVRIVRLMDLSLIPLASETLVTVFRSDRRPLLVARPGGGDDRFVYDELGRLVRRSQRADGAWHDTTFAYDAAGRTIAMDRGNGMNQHWTYDSLGRMTTHLIRDGSVTQNFATLLWEDGQIRHLLDNRGGTEAYSYDEAGRLAGVVYGNGDRATVSWDLRSRRTGVALARGDGSLLRTIALAYDDGGREQAVYDNGVPVIGRTWVSGRLARTEYGNGLVREFAFDPDLGTLTGATMTAGPIPVESTSVRMVDPDCSTFASPCISSQTTSHGATPVMTSERHRLMPIDTGVAVGKRVGFEDSLDGDLLHTYHYDFLSNLRIGPAGDFRYNGEANRLQAIEGGAGGAIGYEYDTAGFVTSRAGVPVTWDGAGRLSSYGSASFVWDVFGRPVSSSVDGVQTTRRFGGLVEADAAGNPRAIDLGEVRIDLTGNETRYRHFDFRGNVKLVTDVAGEVVEHYKYSAYAVEAIHGAGSGTDAGARSFARGRAVGDLVLIGHRLYDPAAARFLAPDPIQQLINQYAYALGNPVQFWDPSGAQAVTNNQTAGAAMQGAGNSLATIGALTMGAGFASLPIPAVNASVGTALLVGGAVLIFVGDQVKARGEMLLLSGGGGSSSFDGGPGAGPGLSAPQGFNENVGPLPGPHSCGAEPCGGGAGGAGEVGGLDGLGGPTGPGGSPGGGISCAPVALGEGALPDGSLALLLFANLAVAGIAWRRSRRVASVL